MDAAGLVALFEERREALLVKKLTDDVAIVEIGEGRLVLAPLGPLPSGFAAEVGRCLSEWTGRAWEVRTDGSPQGVESLKQAHDRARAAEHAQALADPMVQALLAEFPGAELLSPKPPRQPATPPLRSATA
jgi:DNA polymerase-3 subunit gamma/tau